MTVLPPQTVRRERRSLGLYWRLLASYGLVILVAAATLYVASEALAPAFLDWHLEHMQREMPSGHMMSAFEENLAAAHRDAMQRAVLWGVLAATFVAGALSLFVANRIARPLRDMQRASSRIAAGKYQERLLVPSTDEVGALAVSFNEMARTLEETERRRVELLGNVAHEFRTPLSSLRGYVEGIEDGFFRADEETLGACKRQVARMERLMEDLSLLSRVEAGQESIRPEATRIATFIESAVLALQPEFLRKGVHLEVPNLPGELLAFADSLRTTQVLTNLLANALRHTPAGGLVRVTAGATATGEVRIVVDDTGEGIPPHVIPHVFTRFYRADRARSRNEGGGTGIGLTIARHYVQLQGGTIGVSSREGEGSTFWFTLPGTRQRPGPTQ